jgi:hypothetical protein
MNDLQTLCRAYELLDSSNEYSAGRFRKKLINMLEDEDFLRAIFKPQADPQRGVTKDALSAKITQVCDVATKRSTVHALADALEEHGYRLNGQRTPAVFLVTIVNLGMATIDSKATDLGRAKDHEEISDESFNKEMRKLESYQEDLRTILKEARGMVKGPAKKLAGITGVPKELCISALFTVPSAQYLDSYKVGFYLKSLLGNIYGFVDLNADAFELDFDEVDWPHFFKAVFGKERVPDVASLILLEGAERIDKCENKRDVRECWDALTHFALKSLNKAPESVRDQMIELYLKRLNKMLADHNIDLRVDLRMIDNFRFENLANTVKKYKGKIDSIMEKAKTLSNARPETSPT